MQRDVSDLRDLRFERRVPVTVESPGKLAKRLLQALAEETDEEQLRRQGRAMVLLGQLPKGTDLPALVNRVQAESVLGFYLPGDRPPKGGLYVRSSRGLDPYAKIILAHELTHAVTDQRFDLTLADRLAVATARQDELAARPGRGRRHPDHGALPDREAHPGRAGRRRPGRRRRPHPQRDAAPAVIRESMLFPYQEGLRFVRALYQQEWLGRGQPRLPRPAGLDRAGAAPRALPGQPRPAPGGRGRRPERAARRRLALRGRAELRRARRPPAPGRAGRHHRRGGRGRLGRRPPAQLPAGRQHRFLALRTVWDSTAEAGQFCDAMRAWANGRFGAPTRVAGGRRWSGEGQDAALRCRGPRVAWLSAPTPTWILVATPPAA